MGRIGLLAEETTLGDFAVAVKESARRATGSDMSVLQIARIRKVAVCGGSGAFLLRDAGKQGADVLVTGDVKYHEARDAGGPGHCPC